MSTARVEPPVDVPVRLSVAPQLLFSGPSATPAPAITPRSSITWPDASASAWATRTLGFLLRRGPTSDEVTAWTTALAGGTPPAQLVADVLFDPAGTWAARETKVARLYAAFFARPADTAGLAYWSDRLAAGASISVVAESFARSPEFRARFGTGTHADFVDLVYRNVLGRAPDADGLAFWVGRLQAGRTRGWVMAAFSESPEGRMRLAAQADPVVAAYALAGAVGGRQAWEDAVAWLRSGGSRLSVIEAVRTSDAFAAR